MPRVFAGLVYLNARVPRAPAYPPNSLVVNLGAQPYGTSQQVSLSPAQLPKEKCLHSKNSAAKLMHTFPSHWRPRFATVPGIPSTSISSTLWRIPSRERKPTMIFGTPSRNDWIQNFMSFRSKLSLSRSLRISAEVLSSTQWIGSPGLGGFESQTMCDHVS